MQLCQVPQRKNLCQKTVRSTVMTELIKVCSLQNKASLMEFRAQPFPSPVLTVIVPRARFGFRVNPDKWQEKEFICYSSASPKATL